jgi:hypothetical protein
MLTPVPTWITNLATLPLPLNGSEFLPISQNNMTYKVATSTLLFPITRTILTGNTTFYVNAATGVDTVLGGSISAPWKTLQYARNVVQNTYDLAGYNIIFNCVGAFTAGLYAQGCLTGQQSSTSETWSINGTVTVASGATAFEAVYNAQYQITVPTGSLSIVTSGAGGVGFGASAGGVIIISGQATITINGGWNLVTSWGGLIIHNNIFTLGSGLGFSFASGGVIQGNNGAVVTFSQVNMIYSIATYWSYATGVIGLGVTFSGGNNVIGMRYLCSQVGTITTGNQGPTYIPGTIPGITNTGGQYDYNVPAQNVFNAITGCLPTAISGTHTTAAITVSAGIATDSTNLINIICAGYSWAAANGNAANGTDAASSTLGNSSTYHMYLCMGASGVCTYASASLSPTPPVGYQLYLKRIFSFLTNGSGSPINMTCIEAEGGSYYAYYAAEIADASSATVTSTRSAVTVSTPLGIRTQYLGRVSNSSSTVPIVISSLDEPATSASTVNDVESSSGLSGWIQPFVTTNTSSQIGAISVSSISTLGAVTRGFKDWRRV